MITRRKTGTQRLTEDSDQEGNEELRLRSDDLVQMHQCECKPAQSGYYCAGCRWRVIVVLEHGGDQATRTEFWILDMVFWMRQEINTLAGTSKECTIPLEALQRCLYLSMSFVILLPGRRNLNAKPRTHIRDSLKVGHHTTGRAPKSATRPVQKRCFHVGLKERQYLAS